MKKVLINLLAVFLFAAGFLMLIYPEIQSQMFQYGKKQEIKEFRHSVASGGESVSKPEAAPTYDALLDNMKTYNQKIYEEKQTELKDPWSYEENIFDFASMGLEDDMIGYITIDAMDVEIPLYIGAGDENLRRGAAVLTQTSMPIGGENTNTVIAAHRGTYHGDAMFRDIEVLKPGDRIQITNLWETLDYEVIKNIVTLPDDIDAVKIVDGEELVTLVTCHPYGDNYQRYVVYCRRADMENVETDKELSFRLASEGIDYESSQQDIYKEKVVRMIGYVVFGTGVLFVLGGFIFHRCRKKERRKRRRRR